MLYCSGVINLPANFGVSVTFRSRLMGQQLSDGLCDLANLTIDLGGLGVVGDTGLRDPSVYQF